MKFRVDQHVFTEAVSWSARSLPQRPPVPVLSGLLITASENGTVEFTSFDYEVSTRGKIEAEVQEAGTILVSGRLLSEIAKALPNKPVLVELDETKVQITCGASKFSLATMPVAEYPTVPELPEILGQLDTKEFSEAISQVSIAASKDDSLPVLTGIRVEIQGSNITLLATDRYRLALRELHWQPRDSQIEHIALIRAKTLTDATRSATGTDIELGLQTSTGQDLVGISSESRQTTSLLLDGEYPAVRRLFPESSPITAVVSTDDLLAAAKRVSLVAEHNTPIRLHFTDGQVALDAGQGDDAQASEVLEANLFGEDITVAFNPQFLQEGLTALHAPYVRFGFTHPTKPVDFVGQESLDGEPNMDYRYLLVPIRFAS